MQAAIHKTDKLGTRCSRARWNSVRAVFSMIAVKVSIEQGPRAAKRQRHGWYCFSLSLYWRTRYASNFSRWVQFYLQQVKNFVSWSPTKPTTLICTTWTTSSSMDLEFYVFVTSLCDGFGLLVSVSTQIFLFLLIHVLHKGLSPLKGGLLVPLYLVGRPNRGKAWKRTGKGNWKGGTVSYASVEFDAHLVLLDHIRRG